jgi:hypothetical protein
LLFGIAVFGGMIVLCIIGWSYGGAGGLIGGTLGFLVRLGGRGLDWGERLGNGYIGAGLACCASSAERAGALDQTGSRA